MSSNSDSSQTRVFANVFRRDPVPDDAPIGMGKSESGAYTVDASTADVEPQFPFEMVTNPLANFNPLINTGDLDRASSMRHTASISSSMVGLGDDTAATMIAGRYRVRGAVGEGSWGEVLSGWDTVTREPIAAKLTRQGSTVAVESLLREFLVYLALAKFRGRDVPFPSQTRPVDKPTPRSPAKPRSSDDQVSIDASQSEPPRVYVATAEIVVGLPQVLHFESTLAPQSLDWTAREGRISRSTLSEDDDPSACLVMRMLGPSLEQLRQYCLGAFDEATILMIADQAVGRLEHVHRCGMVHRDIKPENFLMGIGPAAHTLFLIDYGLTMPYREGITLLELAHPESIEDAEIENLPHIPEHREAGVAGTLRYASANAMRGMQQSRRDDLQALVYCCVYLATGTLPWVWTGVKEEHRSTEDVIKLKESTTVNQLCEKCPYLARFAAMVQGIEYDGRPPYGALRHELRHRMNEDGLRYDYMYSWSAKRADEVAMRGTAHQRRESAASSV